MSAQQQVTAQPSMTGQIARFLWVHFQWPIVGGLVGIIVATVLAVWFKGVWMPPVQIAAKKETYEVAFTALEQGVWLIGLVLGVTIVMVVLPTWKNLIVDFLSLLVFLGWVLPDQAEWVWGAASAIASAILFFISRFVQHNISPPAQTVAARQPTVEQPAQQQAAAQQAGGGVTSPRPGAGGVQFVARVDNVGQASGVSEETLKDWLRGADQELAEIARSILKGRATPEAHQHGWRPKQAPPPPSRRPTNQDRGIRRAEHPLARFLHRGGNNG